MKDVRIKEGFYKGLEGIVVADSEKTIQIQCLSGLKSFIILMEKENLKEKIELCQKEE